MRPTRQTPLTLALVALAACQGPGLAEPDRFAEPRGDTPDDGEVFLAPAVPHEAAPLEGGETDPGGEYVPTPDEGELTEAWQDRLDAREVDYRAALRTASLRLRGDLPTLVELEFLESAPEPREVYEALIDDFLADPRFTQQVRRFWRDSFKMGGGGLDSAPNFAASLVVGDQPITRLFTATSGNCVDFEDGSFVAEDCASGAPAEAGVLTNPDVHRHFFSNLGFRRARWVQETFACREFPAEVGDPTDVGGENPYTAPWPFESIAGARTTGRVDFHDTESVICANCHATMNHVTPLLARFDEDGDWVEGGYGVPLPLDGAPIAERTDWLPEGEGTAWRYGVPAADLPALGAAMAADPEVHHCLTARAWNWAMGHGDVVDALAVVPRAVTTPLVDELSAEGFRFKPVLRAIFTSDDFVRY